MLPLLLGWGSWRADGLPAVPALSARIDWDGAGWTAPGYSGLLALPSATPSVPAGHAVHPLELTFQRGVRADFSGDQTGSATIVLDNSDDAYTPDRNWCDNPSFETGVTGWAVKAVTGLTAAAVSVSQVADSAGQGGSRAGEAVLTGTVNSGVAYRIPYRFRSGQAYSVSVWLKSTAGALTVRAGMASAGTPADTASTSVGITTSWAAYTLAWTPAADRTDAVLFVRTTAAAAATVRIDAVQVNPGAAANAYIEAPTRGQLVPGRPVYVESAWGSAVTPHFYGYIQRITPDPQARSVSILCHDQSQRLANTSVLASSSSTTYRTYRRAILDEASRAGANLVANSSFEGGLNGLDPTFGSPVRVSGDAVDGDWAIQLNGGGNLGAAAALAASAAGGQQYTGSAYLKTTGGGTAAATLQLYLDPAHFTGTAITITGSWQRFSVTGSPASAGLAADGSAGFGYHYPQLAVTGGGGTILADCVAITQGPQLWPWTPEGGGRRPGFTGYGGWEITAPQATTWRAPWRNLVANSSFDDGTTRGWTPSAGTLANDGANAKIGGRSMKHTAAASTAPTNTRTATGTFKAGTTYYCSLWAAASCAFAGASMSLKLGPTGTLATAASSSDGSVPALARLVSSWTPAADTGTVNIVVTTTAGSGGPVSSWVDAVMLTDAGGDYGWQAAFPGGLTAGGASVAQAAGGYVSAQCMQLTVPAAAGAAIAMDQTASGPVYLGGMPYTISFWHRLVSGTTDWQVSAGASGLGEASRAFTPGPVWQRCVMTWTAPSTLTTWMGASGRRTEFALAIGTPSGTGTGAVLIDGLRIELGGYATDIQPDAWVLDAAEADLVYGVTGPGGTGGYTTAASALSALNANVIGRQALLPSPVSPYWRYISTARRSASGAALVETITEDITSINGLERDEASVINSQAVWYAADSFGPVVVSDDASTGVIGGSPGATLNNPGLVSTQVEALDIAQTIVNRYRQGVMRPVVTVVNRFPSQLWRDIGDLVAVTYARGMLTAVRFTVMAVQTRVSEAGQRWETVYTLEEAP